VNRKSVTRARRKEIMRLGTITWEGWLNSDEDGSPKLPRKEWGYSVHADVNGWHIAAPDHNPFEAYKACLECARMCMEKRPDEV